MMDEQGKRACRATVLIVAFVLTVPLSAQALELAGSTVELIRSESAIVTTSLAGEESDCEGAVDAYAQAFGIATQAGVPDAFCQECFDPSGEEGLMVSDGGELIGYRESKECREAFLELAERLQERGWLWVESGEDAVATFTKKEGAYRWLYAACADAGTHTSVVIQVVGNE